MWRPQLERVPQGWRYLAPDLRGFGGSPRGPLRPTMDDYAADVEAVLDALEIETAGDRRPVDGRLHHFRPAPPRARALHEPSCSRTPRRRPTRRKAARAGARCPRSSGRRASARSPTRCCRSFSRDIADPRDRGRDDAPADRSEHRRGDRPRHPRDDGPARLDARPATHAAADAGDRRRGGRADAAGGQRAYSRRPGDRSWSCCRARAICPTSRRRRPSRRRSPISSPRPRCERRRSCWYFTVGLRPWFELWRPRSCWP